MYWGCIILQIENMHFVVFSHFWKFPHIIIELIQFYKNKFMVLSGSFFSKPVHLLGLPPSEMGLNNGHINITKSKIIFLRC